MGGGIFTSALIIVILIARFTAYSSFDFVALADSSASSILTRTEVVANVAAAALKRHNVHSSLLLNLPWSRNNHRPSTRTQIRQGAVHPLHEKPNRTSRQLDSPLLPSLVNVNTPRITIHRRLDFTITPVSSDRPAFVPALPPTRRISSLHSLQNLPARSPRQRMECAFFVGRRAGDVPNSTFGWKRLRSSSKILSSEQTKP